MRIKLIIIFVASIIFIISSGPVNASINDEYALRLEKIGVFKGTGTGFELDRPPTRIEGLVMFIRLLGEENEALNGDFAHPFTDVPLWADPYVGFAYEKGYTKGINDNQFGTGNIDAKSYLTFVLRALGYDEDAGDFTWSNSTEFSNQIGLIDQLEMQKYQSNPFLRDDVARISYNALKTNIKSDNTLLIDQLISSDKMNEQMKSLLRFDETIYTYEPVSPENERISMYWNDGKYVYYSNQQDNGYIYKLDRTNMSNTKLLDIKSSFIFVYNNSLYYVQQDNKDNTIGLYTSDLMGKQQRLVTKLPSAVSKAVIDKENLILLFEYDSLYKFDLKSNKLVLLANTRTFSESVVMSNDYVYYYDYYEDRVVSINHINGHSDTLFDSSIGIYEMVAYKNDLYYSTGSKLYRYEIISGEHSLIYDTYDEYNIDGIKIVRFSVINDKIYLLMNMAYIDNYLRQLNLDGTNLITLKKGIKGYSFNSSNGILFYEFGDYFYELTDDGKMELLEIDGKYISDIVESYDNAFYYVASEDKESLYRYDPLTNENKLIYKSFRFSRDDIVYIYDENTIYSDSGYGLVKTDTRLNDFEYEFMEFKGNCCYTFYDDYFYAVYTNFYVFEGIYRGDLITNEENMITPDSIFDYQVEDDGIYYTLFSNSNNVIKKVSLDGITTEIITTPSNFSTIESNGVDLYFADHISFYKYNKSDKSFTKIYTSNSLIFAYKIIDNKWYFKSNDQLYYFDLSTKKVSQVSGGIVRSLLFINNKIYPSIYQIGIYDTTREEFIHIK